MSEMVHDYAASLEAGLSGEEVVAEVCRRNDCTVRRATRDEQFAGVDLVVTTACGETVRVEVKTDRKAHRTGNAAIELLSNDVTGRPGWLHTCTADWLVYSVPGRGADLLYWLRPAAVRAELPAWMAQQTAGELRGFAAANRDRDGRLYRTTGLLVPLADIERLAAHITSL